MASCTTTPTAPANGAVQSHEGRARLARLVIVGSFLTLFLLVGAIIVLAQADNTTGSDAAKTAFNTVLPVLAGWVGTVLAFYFSSATQERTSASLDNFINRSHAGGGSTTRISEKMIPYAGIVKRYLGDVDGKPVTPKDVSFADILASFDTKLPGGGTVTRLFFVDKGVFKYVLHQATFDAFRVKTPSGTLADLLTDEDTLKQISKLVVFVTSNATLAEAKAALDKVDGAQDIVVTGSGNATEPMLGWLSNVDLIKAIEVG